MQVLEGDAKDVHEIFASIQKDKRNTGVVTLLEENIEQRSFPKWSMGFKTKASFSSTELSGFVDVFNGKLDKTIAIENKSRAVKLLLNFSG